MVVEPQECAAPGCQRRVPGRYNTFCHFHHFLIPPQDTRAILRMKIECANTTNDGIRKHLEEQLPFYIRCAIGKLPQHDRRTS